jgi:hypothetical protein
MAALDGWAGRHNPPMPSKMRAYACRKKYMAPPHGTKIAGARIQRPSMNRMTTYSGGQIAKASATNKSKKPSGSVTGKSKRYLQKIPKAARKLDDLSVFMASIRPSIQLTDGGPP